MSNSTQVELIANLSEATNISKPDCHLVLEHLAALIAENLVMGKKTVLPRLGHFICKTRSERRGRNPRTGERITIPSGRSVRFKPGKSLKQMVSRTRSRFEQPREFYE